MLIKISLLLLSVFFSVVALAHDISPQINICKDPSPPMCTMDYSPVCALVGQKAVKIYSNGCSACGDSKVSAYIAGECQPNSLKHLNIEHSDIKNNIDKDVKKEQKIAIKNVWHAAKLRGVSFRAIGQEPAWLLEIIDGKHFYLSTDYGELVKTYLYVEPKINQAQRITIFEVTDKLLIKIEGKNCTDIMSSIKFSSTVTVKRNKHVFKGCGRALF